MYEDIFDEDGMDLTSQGTTKTTKKFYRDDLFLL